MARSHSKDPYELTSIVQSRVENQPNYAGVNISPTANMQQSGRLIWGLHQPYRDHFISVIHIHIFIHIFIYMYLVEKCRYMHHWCLFYC